MSHLKIGDLAPDFNTFDEKGEPISLKQYKGKKLIIFAYPKAMTPGCTSEACNLNENYNIFIKQGFEIIGISADDSKKQQQFKETYNLKYPLIPDTEKVILNLYGIWGLKKNYGREYEGINRITFIIDENGYIEKIFNKVKTKEHSEQIFEEYKLQK